jgi:hypothetical protein
VSLTRDGIDYANIDLRGSKSIVIGNRIYKYTVAIDDDVQNNGFALLAVTVLTGRWRKCVF